MSRKVELFYDIVSPYSFIGFELLCRYRSAWGLAVELRPFLLGGVMKGAGNSPPAAVKAKGEYVMRQDVPLVAKHCGVPIRMTPAVVEAMFAKGTLSTQRFLTAVQQLQPQAMEPLSRELWLRLFSRHQDIAEPASLREAAVAAGIESDTADAALAAMVTNEVKQKLKDVTEEAIAIGAFGAPTFVVHLPGGRKQMLFGCDRFPVMADLLGVEYAGPMKHLSKL